ncbi:MAG: DUF4160 domain-containing protein [Woronichinia naegeliana WA131]|jgi:hypothetical protein|uniref:DUF4160 domain-containing protein n=1 Tax=Woronichinia naegeliana WA131 TaxID=2824559 RepID=A0A977PTY3_9CYAN|nr:MAG: DUF4160 domain-containing protein [Woronichinia naegeliana WA131]
MPTLLTVGPYRFFCYAGDQNEPPHIHIERDKSLAKFWLQPVRLQNNQGFSRVEINRVQKLVETHQEQLLRGWHDFFND